MREGERQFVYGQGLKDEGKGLGEVGKLKD